MTVPASPPPAPAPDADPATTDDPAAAPALDPAVLSEVRARRWHAASEDAAQWEAAWQTLANVMQQERKEWAAERGGMQERIAALEQQVEAEPAAVVEADAGSRLAQADAPGLLPVPPPPAA